MRHFLGAGVDRCGSVLRPVRPPSPAHRRHALFVLERQHDLHLGGGRDVVARLQRCAWRKAVNVQEVVDLGPGHELGDASAHGIPLHQVLEG